MLLIYRLEPGQLSSSHAPQTSHQLVGHCRSLSATAQADHQTTPPQRDKVDGRLQVSPLPDLAVWMGKAEGCFC